MFLLGLVGCGLFWRDVTGGDVVVVFFVCFRVVVLRAT